MARIFNVSEGSREVYGSLVKPFYRSSDCDTYFSSFSIQEPADTVTPRRWSLTTHLGPGNPVCRGSRRPKRKLIYS